MTVLFEIIVGTYEQFLLGFKVEKSEKKCTLVRSFATHSHVASIRSVDSKKHYLASGGADDSIYLYDMKSRKETGKLVHHTGTVNSINFTPDGSHLLTCSNDGSIGVVRCGNWQVEKHWKSAHKVHKDSKEVTTLAVHPSGKLSLSVGRDGVLKTWNLVKGRQAYATNLIPKFKYDAKNLNILNWSINGDKYLMAVNNKIDVYLVETAGILVELSFDTKIVCIDFITNDIIAIGHEDGQVRIYNIIQKKLLIEKQAHDSRVKCIKCFKKKYIVTASSSGEIKLWKYSNNNFKKLASANCDARITCMTISTAVK